ncbi:kynureninase [Chromatocurvus halotolerans]|uniref:Kynureninase n=1 Tax=Chromatocurvus halotolerans TaxID=1132028 RepID=A0A4R2KV54_9GAMM|nr:kynureninase [Chromatocurvus halotolerans]TCO78351.1 kynureninase [Chromatocurvus halotolerans]
MNRRDEATRLDSHDPLRAMRDAFALPQDRVYLDGNSLGALPRCVSERVRAVVDQQWGRDLITSWNVHGWVNLPLSVGEKIAPLIGAAPGQVVCCDSISVNLFKLLATALGLRPSRRVVLTCAGDFPTDAYMGQGLHSLLGAERCEMRAVGVGELADALDETVAVLMMTEVDFRSGRRHDMRELTAAAHACGALVLWDLAHSAGALPVDLDDCGVDMAVGCGYKFLNGGPGAPAFLYLAQRHHNQVTQPLSGWFGHAAPFAFDPDYRAAPGISAYQAGTPGVIGMQALDAALDLFTGLEPASLRRKSLALTGFFMEGVAADPALAAMEVLTPTEEARRGSQVSLRHPEAHAIAQCLIAAGVIVDFRDPDIVRFGFAPLYNSFTDAAIALQCLSTVLSAGAYANERYRQRAQVT